MTTSFNTKYPGMIAAKKYVEFKNSISTIKSMHNIALKNDFRLYLSYFSKFPPIRSKISTLIRARIVLIFNASNTNIRSTVRIPTKNKIYSNFS